MKTVQETIDEMQSTLEGWVLWAQRLEAAFLANPVECRCWRDNNRSGSQDHFGRCAEWRAVASSIRTKPAMSPGPALAAETTLMAAGDMKCVRCGVVSTEVRERRMWGPGSEVAMCPECRQITATD